MKRICVLGCGRVGSVIALELAKKYSVTACDISNKNAAKMQAGNVNFIAFNLKDKALINNTIKPFDLLINAVPGHMGFATLKEILLAGKNVVDISFFPENAFELHEIAIKNNVAAFVDCGVAPGMSNLVLGRYNAELKVEEFRCMVGGLPKIRKLPFEYKAPFSPIDVIEEYTRPARLKIMGVEVVKEALSDPEFVHFDMVGTLEAFNTDGLRSLLHSMPHIPTMIEKTLRYPGHISLINALKSVGFFNEKEIDVNGVKVSPLAVSSALLFDDWYLQENEKEFTVMKIEVKGTDTEGKMQLITYDLYDENDPKSGFSSMARTTGFSACAVANLFLQDKLAHKGINPPELLGANKAVFDAIIAYQAQRGVHYSKKKVNLFL